MQLSTWVESRTQGEPTAPPPDPPDPPTAPARPANPPTPADPAPPSVLSVADPHAPPKIESKIARAPRSSSGAKRPLTDIWRGHHLTDERACRQREVSQWHAPRRPAIAPQTRPEPPWRSTTLAPRRFGPGSSGADLAGGMSSGLFLPGCRPRPTQRTPSPPAQSSADIRSCAS